MLPRDLLAQTRDRKAEAERLLEALVNEPSGSEHREGVARVVERIGALLDDMGFRVETIREDGHARHVVARLRGTAAPAGARPVLLVGHADTVFPPTDGGRFALDGEDLIRGPGSADMKGGLAVALEAVRAIAPALRSSAGALDVIVNGDEELGSPASKDLILELAAGARAVLVFENCEEEDGLIIARKGLGRATVRVRGRAAHAGIDPHKGASAVVEMAREILDVARLDDPAAGLGVVIGLARGGTSRNTVPPEAWFEIDLRYDDRRQGERALAAIGEIAGRPGVPGTAAAVEGELHRPPMPSEPGRDLFARAARAAAATLGRPLRGLTSRGGSDANLTADMGIPTLDGLGVVGGDIHTPREWVLRRSLPDRAALTAVLMGDLLELLDMEAAKK